MSVTSPASVKETSIPEPLTLIERLVERGNMETAYKKVVSNKGSAGIDKMSVDQLKAYLIRHWAEIKSALLNGTYNPKAGLQVLIPKPKGGHRQLGIPTVLDRLIQQALQQVLNPLFDPYFSENSYGFRKGRSTHDAVMQAREFQRSGKRWVVDMDLAKFFDEVNHDILMSKIFRKVKDKQILRLIRKYLCSGIMADGVSEVREKGTPQGSPLSPLLSNIMLDELDKELDRRGHAYCRYADDCNIYVSSKRAGERVLQSISRFLEKKLRLKVNRGKSAAGRPWQRTFLGYSFTHHKDTRIRVPKESIQRFRMKAKQLFRQGRGRNIGRFIQTELNALIRGWITYFRLSEVKGFAEELDSWIRRRLRLIIWRQWKRPKTRYKRLLKLGFTEQRAGASAYNGRGAWWNSGASHMNAAFRRKYFDRLELFSMLSYVTGLRQQ